MLYDGGMAHEAKNDRTHRTVVLLRPTEKKQLARLAKEQKVSASEIIRRSLHAYQPEEDSKAEEEDFRSLLVQMNTALDSALDNVRSARMEVAENIQKMRTFRAQHT